MMAKIISWVVQNSDTLWSNTGPWAYWTLWLSGSVNLPKPQVGYIIDSNIIKLLVTPLPFAPKFLPIQPIVRRTLKHWLFRFRCLWYYWLKYERSLNNDVLHDVTFCDDISWRKWKQKMAVSNSEDKSFYFFIVWIYVVREYELGAWKYQWVRFVIKLCCFPVKID